MSRVLEENPIAQVVAALGQAGQVLPTNAWVTHEILIGPSVPDDLLLRLRFDQLVRAWKQDTRYSSSLSKIVMHPSYQAIIGMGPAVLPLIFAELQHSGGHWFWALHAITQAHPAHEGDTYDAAVRAWLAWGRARGYV